MAISQSQEDAEIHAVLAGFVSRMDLIDDTVLVEHVFNRVGNDGFIHTGYIGPKPVKMYIDFRVVLDRWEKDGRIKFLSKEGFFPTWRFRFDRGLCGLPKRGSAQGGPLPQIDALTGLYVRGSFDSDLEALIVDANVSGAPLALAMIDIDYFKAVNDTYGHQAGDLVLKEIAQETKAAACQRARVYRYGGEELAILMPNFVLEEAIATSERIRQTIQVKRILFEGKAITVTASVGVGAYLLGESAAELVKRADQGLYLAKHGGRNRVCKG